MESDARRPTSSSIRQIAASLIAGSFSIVCGSSLAYSGIVVPQILDRENGTSFNVSSSEILWISSSTSLAIPIGVALSGLTMDVWGRLVTLKLSIIPNVIGWALIATAQNGLMIVLGRIFTGISFALASGPSFVYISEVSDPNFRGALLCFPGIFFSVGILLTYFKGWLINWRWVSWIYLLYAVVSVAMTMLLPETPSWLVSKGRQSEARKSLRWFGRDLKKDELVELVDQSAQMERGSKKVDFKVFLQPTCYKPFAIVSMLFALQQFSGLYVITLNSVIFFKVSL
uniref:Major facilitator superfamily (MFS) profile domain-containing protein n=1 Tax=Photinus pyralis TaxID=7054 RepID=A0A1Y1KER9_PHOPY